MASRRTRTRKTRGGELNVTKRSFKNKVKNMGKRVGNKFSNLTAKAQVAMMNIKNKYNSTFQKYGGGKTRRNKHRGGDMKVYAALNKTLTALGYSNAEKNTVSDDITNLITKLVNQIEMQKKAANKNKTKRAGEYQEVSCNELSVTLTTNEKDKKAIDTIMKVFGQQGQMNSVQNKALKGIASLGRSIIGMKNRTLGKEKSNEILNALMENGKYTASFCEIKPFRERLLRFASL